MNWWHIHGVLPLFPNVSWDWLQRLLYLRKFKEWSYMIQWSGATCQVLAGLACHFPHFSHPRLSCLSPLLWKKYYIVYILNGWNRYLKHDRRCQLRCIWADLVVLWQHIRKKKVGKHCCKLLWSGSSCSCSCFSVTIGKILKHYDNTHYLKTDHNATANCLSRSVASV